jgi:hypothetical protein
VEAVTLAVEIVKVPLLDPPGIITDAGTVAAALLDDNATSAPPAGATPVSATVPVEVWPPVTLDGFSATLETDTSAGGLTEVLKTTSTQ